MTTNDNESAETPDQRVAALTDAECRAALVAVVAAITADRSTRAVPDLLHAARLLARFEVYDADAAWTDLEDIIRAGARCVAGVC